MKLNYTDQVFCRCKSSYLFVSKNIFDGFTVVTISSPSVQCRWNIFIGDENIRQSSFVSISIKKYFDGLLIGNSLIMYRVLSMNTQ
jgi:hypothetical protein